MSDGSSCCCRGDCQPFFHGWSTQADDWCATNFDDREELRYSKDRPYTDITSACSFTAGPRCSSEQFNLAKTCAEEFGQRVKYEHYNADDPSEVCSWYFDFVGSGFCNPPCVWGGWQDSQNYNDPTDVGCCESVPQPATGCSQNYFVMGYNYDSATGFSPRAMSANQEKMITDTRISCLSGQHPRCQPYEHYNRWRWLEGIANHDTSLRYARFHWNGLTHVRAHDDILQHTLFGVLHQEKWWKRYHNNLNPYDNPPPNGSDLTGPIADCSCPKYFGFGGTGVPIFHWELLEAFGEIETVQLLNSWRALAKCSGSGSQCNENGERRRIQRTVIDKLVEGGFLDIGDYNRADGKCIRKTMKPRNRPHFEQFFWGRYGGWTHICHDQEYAGMEAHWPFLPRITTSICHASGDSNIYTCLSAQPGPKQNECTCSHNAVKGDACDPDGCGGTMNCIACGETYCLQGALSGNCHHALISFAGYEKPIDSTRYINRFTCEENLAWLRRTNSSGFPLVNPITQRFYDLPPTPEHIAPPNVTKSILSGNTPKGDKTLCCGVGAGTICKGGLTSCFYLIPVRLGSSPCLPPVLARHLNEQPMQQDRVPGEFATWRF